MAPVGRPPKPVERRRRTGNPGKRTLPDLASVTTLPAVEEPPDAPRILGTHGLNLWGRAWTAARTWLSADTDLELLLMVCEQVDERVALRVRVFQDGDTDDRKALRQLDGAITSGLSLLGFTPTDRARLGVAEVQSTSKMEELRARRQAK